MMTPAESGSSERTSVTFMSRKTIVIEPGTRHYQNFAFGGGGTIDLTSALGPGVVITLGLQAIFAGWDILLPEGVRVVDESLQIGVMGLAGSDVEPEASGDGSQGTVVLKGFLWAARLEVKLVPTPPS